MQHKPLIILLGLLLLGLCLSAATCENQDYRALEVIELSTTEGADPLSRTILHPYSGRNVVDFVLYNQGEEAMQVRLTAATVRPSDEGGEDAGVQDSGGGTSLDVPIFLPPLDATDSPDAEVDADTPDAGFNIGDYLNGLDDESPNISQRTISVGPGQQRIGRFGEEEGLIGITMIVQVECLTPSCQGRLEFVILLGRLECRSSDDCDNDQVCEATTGRCVAASNAGCQVSPQARPGPLWPLALLALAALLWWGRRHRSTWMALVACLLLWTALPSTSYANRAAFSQPTSQLTLSGGLKQWTGALADDAQTGLSLDITEALHYRYLGLQLSVGTAYYLTRQQGPPLSSGMQTYSLRLGPRLIVPWRQFQFLLDVEYERLGLISNSLVSITGPGLSYHAAGVGVSARWVPLPFLMDVRVGYTQVFGLDAGIMGVWLSLGRLGRL